MHDETLAVLSPSDLTRVAGGENQLIYQGPLDNGNFVNCEPKDGGFLSCGEFVPGKNEAVRTWQMRPYLYDPAQQSQQGG